jgi:urease accessory protein UreH
VTVDEALKQVEEDGTYAREGSDLFVARVLAAEVERLRETGLALRDLVRRSFEQWESEADSGDVQRDAALAIYEVWVRTLKGER